MNLARKQADEMAVKALEKRGREMAMGVQQANNVIGKWMTHFRQADMDVDWFVVYLAMELCSAGYAWEPGEHADVAF